MAPRKPSATNPLPAKDAVLGVQKYVAELQKRIAALAAEANGLQPPVVDNEAAEKAYVRRAGTFPAAIQLVLAGWFELLYSVLPRADADETAKSCWGYLNDQLVQNALIPTARTNVLGPGPVGAPGYIDRFE